ncbi:hypothetical protein, partial [Pseudomonas syringae]|uniref:hypothetical protein n=1 Tax=Pseudomonas syringae TaxID=317 RepID=UPI001E3CCA1D
QVGAFAETTISAFSHSLFWRVFSFWPLSLQQDACDFLIPMPLLQPNSYKGVFSGAKKHYRKTACCPYLAHAS